MLEINPKKFKGIQNKAVPSPLRPKFRNSGETNIYFLSKRKFNNEKKKRIVRSIKVVFIISLIVIGSYLLSK